MEKRNTNRQREHRDEYRQHSPAWIRAQRRKRKLIMRRRIMIGGAVICVVLIAGVIRIFSGGKEPWKRDGGQCHRGIHIPGIRYQRKWNFLKGNDEK